MSYSDKKHFKKLRTDRQNKKIIQLQPLLTAMITSAAVQYR